MPTIAQMSTPNYWQTALDLAERQRNYDNQYNGSTTHSYAGTSGGEGGGGASSLVYGDVKQPDWNGPDAYGLNLAHNGMEFGPGSEDQLAAMLSRIRQFDPDAKIGSTTHTAGGDDARETAYQTINFDESKLPKQLRPDLVQAGQYGSDKLFNTDNSHLELDPHYGVMTSKQNLKPDEPGWLDKYGPLLVGAFGMGAPLLFGAAGLGMGAAGSAAIGGAQGGLAAAEGGMGGLEGGSQLALNATKGGINAGAEHRRRERL
jgi:hypothetical protein